jgi:branched-chain amino acid transport system ATP-binding protein
MLRLESINMFYGAIHAVQNVSITVRPKEVVTIIGANGAGKSTLLKGIVGLEPIAQGRIMMNDQDATHMPPHKRLGLGVALSPEGRGVFPDQSVLDNLLLGALTKKYERKVLEAKVQSCFEMFPRLKERQDQMSGTLSGGEQQMLAIARALMSEPKLLLLDEPSMGLAPLVIKDIFRIIHVLRETGLTILLVEQMANQALAVADRAYVLENGCITLEGPGEELKKNPKVRAAYLGVH